MFGAFSSSDVRTSDTIKSMLSLTIRSKKLTVGFENSSSKYPLKTDVSKYADLIMFKDTRNGHQIPVAQFPTTHIQCVRPAWGKGIERYRFIPEGVSPLQASW
jgi:hypothetical protein